MKCLQGKLRIYCLVLAQFPTYFRDGYGTIKDLQGLIIIVWPKLFPVGMSSCKQLRAVASIFEREMVESCREQKKEGGFLTSERYWVCWG